VNRVIDHIREHLAEPLTLGELARVAAFSPFHFDRVFKAVAGETLFEFVQRVRVDRAASALLARRDDSVLEIALDHGFASAATFARAFRARFGMSATRWRAGGGARWRARHGRNPGKHVRKLRKAGGRRARNTRGGKEAVMSVRVQQQPAYHVAYMRYVGPFGPGGIPELWERFNRWREAHDLFRPDSITLGVTNDDPGISGDKARYDACVVVPREFAPDRLVNMMDIPSGTYAVAGFVGTARDIVPAWEQVFAAWLPGSGYQPDDRPCYELYRGDPTVDGAQGSFRCDLCLPVRPL
jgi:AraC family transcriptional regulator